jgi:hypothetical protein
MGIECHFPNTRCNEHIKIANIHYIIETSDPVIFRQTWIKLLISPLQHER